MENEVEQGREKQKDPILGMGKSDLAAGSGNKSNQGKDYYLSGKKLFFYFFFVLLIWFVTAVLFVLFLVFFYGNFCGLGRI